MSCMKEDLLAKIESCEIVCGVVGLGYVGLPLAVEKAKAGFKTIGFDVQSEKVDMVNEGRNYIGDVVDSDLERLVHEGTLSATTDFSFVAECRFHRHLRSYASRRASAARHLVTWRRPPRPWLRICARVPWWCWSPPPIRARPRSLSSPFLEEGSGLDVWEGFLPGFFSRARGSRQSGVQDEEHAQGGGRHRRGRHRSHCGHVRGSAGGRRDARVVARRWPRWRRSSRTRTAM